jgi:GDP-4-dehydro-6-deoxy-D-mannose reductase
MAEQVLITGVSGFVGRALERRARAAGARCVGVCRTPGNDPDHRAVDLAAGSTDLARLLEAESPDVVYHLAGGPAGADAFLSGIQTTRHVLEALRSVPRLTPRVVVVGSAAEYGDLGSAPIREDARERPVNEYGVAKLTQTRLALVARRSGMRVVVARPFNIIGPGMSSALAPARFAREVLAAVAAGRGEISTGDLSPVRDYLELDDVARALWSLGHSDAEDEIVNVCSGRPVAMRDLLGEILRQTDAKLEVRTASALVRGPGEIAVSVGSNSRLTDITGELYSFSLSSAITRLLAWVRNAVK